MAEPPVQPPDARAPSDAILTVPNLLTFVRLGLTPLFLYLALALDALGPAVAVAALGVGTDLLDGRIARRYGQISKLGIVLDPLADRAGIAAASAVLIARDLAPFWAVAAVLGRDVLLVLIGAPLLRARGIPVPPVTRIGKWGSFTTSIALAVLLASGIGSVADPSEPTRIVGFVLLAVGLTLYWLAGVGYIAEGVRRLRGSEGFSDAGPG